MIANYEDLDSEFKSSAETQLKNLEARLAEINAVISKYEAQRNAITPKIYALKQLLGIRESNPSIKVHQRSELAIQNGVDPSQSWRSPADVAADILAERNGEPMHYRELATEVMDRGDFLPERSPAATLNAMMNRDRRFIRPFRRGFYALKRDHPNVNISVGARRRKRNQTSTAKDDN